MKKRLVFAISIAAATAIYAADTNMMQVITVVGNADPSIGFETENNDNINSQGFNKNSIDTFGKSINNTPLQIINMSPSVNFEPSDIFGENESSYHDPMRIRGKNQSGPGAVITIEGIPVAGNPGGGKTIYDMENFSWIDLYKGYIPVDKSLGFSNLIGKVDMSVERPSNEFSGSVSQMFGKDAAKRTFFRVDTGKIGDLSAFASFSSTAGNKWKGDGDLKRESGMMGLVYKPSDAFKAEVYAIRNSDQHHNYYGLVYDQIQNLGDNYNKDWSTTRTRSSYTQNGSTYYYADYYDWNKQKFLDTVIFANLEYKPTSSSKINFKPYWTHDEGEYWYSALSSNFDSYNSGKPSVAQGANKNKTKVTQWEIDHGMVGAVAEYEQEFLQELNMKVGYWYGRQQPPGPPEAQRKYSLDANSNLVFKGWDMLAKNDDHIFKSPFISFNGEKDRWSYSAGVRYMNLTVGALTSYTNPSSTAIANSTFNYDAAIANSTVNTNASVEAKTFTEILPSAFISYKADNSTDIYLDYGRTYGYDVNLFPSYVANQGACASNVATCRKDLNSIKLQTLWDKQKLEISDNFDIGVKYKNGNIVYTPNVFMTKVSGKQADIYDPTLNVQYPTNNVDALSYGLELAANGALSSDLDFMASASYNKYYYTDDFRTEIYSTNTTNNGSQVIGNHNGLSTKSIKGNQIPDTPAYSVKAAITYKINQWKFTPMARYIGSRYGDLMNTQKVPAYTVMDMDISYTQPKLFGNKEGIIRLSMINLLGKEYISSIVTADNALGGTGSPTTYQAGSPFGAYLSANVKF